MDCGKGAGDDGEASLAVAQRADQQEIAQQIEYGHAQLPCPQSVQRRQVDGDEQCAEERRCEHDRIEESEAKGEEILALVEGDPAGQE